MRIGLLIKGNSKKLAHAKLLIQELKTVGFEVIEEFTSSSSGKIQLQSLLHHKCEIIIAAGGDGTLHETINTIIQEEYQHKVKVAIFPIGTANDYAKSIAVNSDIQEFIELIKLNSFSEVDIGKIETEGQINPSYFINIADAGIGGEIIHRVNRSNKKMGGIIYTSQIIKGLITFKRKIVSIKTEEGEIYTGKLLSFVIAKRKEAISTACALAHSGDILLIAGKGPEREKP